jgi:hypothetical protein
MPSRRTVLGAVVLVAAAGGGAAAGLQRPLRKPAKAPVAEPPAWLVAAIDREHQLISGLQTALASDADTAATLSPVLNDHNAHLAALLALPGAPKPSAPKPSADPSAAASSPTASPADAPAPSRATLAAAESAAATAAAAQSAAQSGSPAVLLASIAACEATHGQWLS